LARLLIGSGGTDPTGSNVAQSTDAGPVTGGQASAARQYDLAAAAGGRLTALPGGTIWPPPQAASGRYLDGLIVTYFVVGAVVLLRAKPRFILICAGCTAVLTGLSAIIVSVYAGSSWPTHSFPTGFNFGEPAVLTQDWSSANVFVASAVALGLLGIWILIALAARRWSAVILGVRVSRMLRGLLVAGLAVVSLVAVTQMTSRVSQAATPTQERRHAGPGAPPRRPRSRARPGSWRSPGSSHLTRSRWPSTPAAAYRPPTSLTSTGRRRRSR
jgi:hypothetical protein